MLRALARAEHARLMPLRLDGVDKQSRREKICATAGRQATGHEVEMHPLGARDSIGSADAACRLKRPRRAADVHESCDAAAVQDVRIVDVLEQREERGERGTRRASRPCALAARSAGRATSNTLGNPARASPRAPVAP
jgi:hypothetical protein